MLHGLEAVPATTVSRIGPTAPAALSKSIPIRDGTAVFSSGLDPRIDQNYSIFPIPVLQKIL
jgi:hypothetical protein